MGDVIRKDKHREIMLNVPIQEITSFDLEHMMSYIHFLHTGITIAPNDSIRENFITKFRELVSHEGIEPLVFLRILEILFEIRDIQFLREFVTPEREQKIEDLIRPDASPRLFPKVENPRDLP